MDPGKILQRSSRNAAATAAAQAEFNEKRRYWITDDTEGFLAGWIKSPSPPGGADANSNASVEVVISSTNETRTVPFYSLAPMNPPQFDGVEDIADLTHLNEASVINNLKQRYGSGSIYTYSGLFLISLNPYRDLPIYTPRIISQYRTRRREENAPHIFAVAERAWQQIGEERESQSILITGESGAGKTENTKKVIQYLAAIASSTVPPSSSFTQSNSTRPTPSSSSTSLSTAPSSGLPRSGSFKGKMAEEISLHAISSSLGLLERQILQANPILEAFGNAQTMRNNNSSRFGKFIRIFFNPSGAIAGANIDWYLLEKSRVTRRSKGERGFHVFYQLVKGAKEAGLADKLLLDNKPQDYSFLNGSQIEIEGVDDLVEWRALQSALDIVGFSKAEQFELFRIPAVILRIGNLLLSGTASDQAHFPPETQSTADKVCHLLGIPVKEFTRAVLQPKVRAGREWVTQSRSKKQAQDELGALCKFMYEKTFGRMVERINTALDRPSDKSLSIGVLDIAGFEIFETNSYEQLLINFTNEKLQQFFNFHMFTLEQEEYTREGIEWDYVNFGLDLQPTIELIESTVPVGILSVLDEECIMPKATDKTFTEKVQQIWEPPKGSTSSRAGGVHPGSAKIKHTRFSQGFVVKHYAGDVEYSTEGWLEKNKDPINDAVAKLLSASEVPAVASLFAEYAEEAAAGIVKKVRRGAFRTVGQRHKEQLNQLMSQLGATQPHFIRCIVPNAQKKPGKVTVNLVLDQLRCNGVLEGIRIARLGYPNRHSFAEFRTRYEVLTPGIIPKGTYMDGRKAAERIAEALDIEKDFYKIGATKIFFKAGVLADLEERRDNLLMDVFGRFQAAARGYMAKRKASKLINRAQAVRTIQRNARVYIQLRDWPWWSLYVKVRPLLAATREDNATSKRAAEAALAKEKERRDEEEKKRLEAIKAQLETQRAKVESELESERQLGADKDRMLERSKAREVELGDVVNKLENQLSHASREQDKLSAEREEAQGQVDKMQGEVEKLQGQLRVLQKDQEQARKREQELLQKSSEKRGLADAADRAKVKLEEEVRRLKSELSQKEEGVRRMKERGELALKEMEGRLNLEKGKSASGTEQITGLNDDIRKAKAAADDARAEVKRHEASLAARTTELRNLEGRIAESSQSLQAAEKDKAALSVKIATLTSQLAARDKERSVETATRSRLEQELDDLRKVMAAKSSEDIKRQEADRSRETEMTRLREQVVTAQKALDDQVAQSQKLSEKLRVDFEGIATAYKAAQGEVKSLKSVIAGKEKEVESARREKERYEREARESRDELVRVRETMKGLQGDLDGMRVTRDQLDKQLAQRQTDFEALEDAVLEIETEKADWAKRMEATTRQLIDESAKRQHFEQQLHKAQVELTEYREAASEIEREMLQVSTDMKTRDKEIALLKSRENKTIVEHVHVLESAKKYAEKQLHEQVGENRRLNGVLKNLEAQRNRLQGDMEDMQRQIELAKASKAKEARQARVSMSAEEKTDRAAYEDERRARVAAEAKIASLEIDLADFKRQLATRSISSSGGPRAAAEARYLRQEEELQAFRSAYDAAREHNERLQQEMADMQRGLKMAQRQVSAAHRDMKERDAEYRQGHQGFGHGHAPGTPSRADLLRGLERSHEVLGRDMSEQLRKLDNAPTTPRKYGHASSGSLSNSNGQGFGTPNGAEGQRTRELEREVEMLRNQLARAGM